MSEDAIADITRHDRDGVSVLEVEGEVDLTNAAALELAVEGSLPAPWCSISHGWPTSTAPASGRSIAGTGTWPASSARS